MATDKQTFEVESSGGGPLPTSKAKFGCCPKVARTTLQISFVVGFVIVFFIGFAIGTAGSQSGIVPNIIQATPAAPPPPWWVLPAVTPPDWLPSPSLGVVGDATLVGFTPSATWDRIAYDCCSGPTPRLFLGLQADGLAVLPVPQPGNMVVAGAKRVPGTAGCNGIVIAGSLGFAGDAAGMTGTQGIMGAGITVLNLTTLSVIKVVPVALGVGVDNGVYDPFTRSVLMTLVNGSVAVLNATSGNLLRTVNVVPGCADPAQPCDPLEYPTVDGRGSLWMTAADQNKVIKMSTTTPAAAPTMWDVSAMNCIDPTGLDVDPIRRHLFVACDNPANPMLLILNADTGAKISTVSIGRGNDGVVYDKAHNLVFASAGTVGTLTVIQQYVAPGGVASYAVREVQFTKVGARTLAVDSNSTGGPFIYVMSADGVYDPRSRPNSDLAGGMFNPNTFAINDLDITAFGPDNGFIANAPPPPWYIQPPTTQPGWVSPVGLTLRGSTRVTGLSPSGQWDRLTWDPSNGGRLFLGLQTDGLVMLTMNSTLSMYWGTSQTATLVPQTAGCNGLIIAGTLGFAPDSARMTGTGGVYGMGITVLNMAFNPPTFVNRVPIVGGVGVDNGVYDPQHGQVIMTLVNGSIVTLSSMTGALMSTINVVPGCADQNQPCDPLEYPVVDGQGSLWMTAADQNSVVKLNTGSLSSPPIMWDVSAMNCIDPTGLDVDPIRRHLFVACQNPANPMLLILNADTGAQITTLPIGRGNDGVIYDPVHNLIFASAGTVGTLTVIQQNVAMSPAGYAVREAQFTKVGARTMAVDYNSAGGPYIYTQSADGWYNPALPPNDDFRGGVFNPNAFKTNSLTVMQYAPASPMMG